MVPVRRGEQGAGKLMGWLLCGPERREGCLEQGELRQRRSAAHDPGGPQMDQLLGAQGRALPPREERVPWGRAGRGRGRAALEASTPVQGGLLQRADGK